MTNDLLPDEVTIYCVDVPEVGNILTFTEPLRGEYQSATYIRADLVSTPNKSAEVDLDDVQGDTPSSKIGGCDYMSFKDASRLFGNYIDCEMRDPCGLNDVAKAMLSYERMIRYLATGKGGDVVPAAPTQIDAVELEAAIQYVEGWADSTSKKASPFEAEDLAAFFDVCAAARAHLAKSKGGV